jgi:hypothetical protein
MSRHELPLPRLGLMLLLAGCAGEPTLTLETAANPAAGFAQSADPVLATDPESGDLLLGFVGQERDSTWQLYFSRSGDGGGSWTGATRVTTAPGEIKPHGEASPRIVAAPGGRVAIIWPQDLKVDGRKWPANRMRFVRSLDGGQTWEPPITLNDDTTGAPVGHTFHGATWTGGDSIITAWLDERQDPSLFSHHHGTAHDPGSAVEGDAAIYAVHSPDFGETWSANAPLWGAVCPCCRVTLARRATGGVVATWRQHFPGDIRDIVTAQVDPALAPSAPTRVHEDNWVYPGCPHTGPALALAADGAQHVSWYSGREGSAGVFLARSDTAGRFASDPVPLIRQRTLPTAHTAVVALARQGSLVAWDIDGDGSRRITLALVSPDGSGAARISVPGSDGAAYPQFGSSGTGQIVVAWHRVQADRSAIGLARIRPGT